MLLLLSEYELSSKVNIYVKSQLGDRCSENNIRNLKPEAAVVHF